MNTASLIAGWYIGTCTNKTANITANLLMTWHATTDEALIGELTLFGELCGGGAFQATRIRDRLRFTTIAPSDHALLNWECGLAENCLIGTYTVRSYYPAVSPELRYQDGTWHCELIRPFGPANNKVRHLFWVYNHDQQSGPFAGEEFAMMVSNRQLPDHALVATEDYTVWHSVAQWRELLPGINN